MPSDQDTIVAIATPPGKGAIGVVRISGSGARLIGKRLCGVLPPPRTAGLRRFMDEHGCEIDEGLALYFPGPGSFTGEDLLELQSHGGTVILSELVNAATAFGARHARPGEFTERAFLNGKLDLAQAEAVADLIDSSSSRAARSAYNALRGRFSSEINELCGTITALRVRIEASVDFPEEAITDAEDADTKEHIAQIRDRLASITTAAQRGVMLNTGMAAAIIGAPNVGKSTLLNRLAETDTAIVSREPGTTRDVVSVDVVLDGLPVRLHDTAGIHDTDDAVEREGIRRAKDAIKRSDLVLYIIEADRDDDIVGIVDDNLTRSVPIITIRNKIDLLDMPPRVDDGPRGRIVQLSALTGEGIGLLRRVIVDTAGVGDASDSEYIARQRHIAALDQADAELACTEDRDSTGQPEITAEHLRRAHHALAQITGEFTTEDLLGEIFSKFCLGK